MKPVIRNISDTARWVAVYRADENDRSDSVFKDPYARRLAGERGELIVHSMESGRQNSWSFVARTFLFDEFIKQHLEADYDMVINLASGLDTRAYRLVLPEKLLWIDVDLPEIISYMESMMIDVKPSCHHEYISIDLSDREARLVLFGELNDRAKKILVVSEGLMGYLSEEQAGSLAYDLSHFKNFKHWLLDIMSPGILPLIQKEMGKLLDDAGTPLKFAPASGEDFFRLFGWKPLESRSKLKTALQLNRLTGDIKEFAALDEPTGPKGKFPWSGVCLFENKS